MKWLRPPHEHVANHKYGDHTNRVVCADRVLTVEKSRERYYPDNEGIPTIRFWFGEKDYHDWYFDKGEETKRDCVFRELT